MPIFDIAVLLGLVLLNGFFALSELAIVSARRPRLKMMADSGDAGAARQLSQRFIGHGALRPSSGRKPGRPGPGQAANVLA